MKHLIDECLSPELAKLAHQKGYEASHVVWLKRGGAKDWELKPLIINGDWTFVTTNSVDFRGSPDKPGDRGQYADVPLHAGLICLNAAEGMDLDLQLQLYEIALDELASRPDLVNQVLEVTADVSDIRILRYALPGT
jgi:Domain of unknown function (DUF5615)